MATGEKVARDYDPWAGDWYDEEHLRARGIGPIADEIIPLCGMMGGGLRKYSDDMWCAESIFTPDFGRVDYLEAPDEYIYERERPYHPTVIDESGEYFRAFGFSPSGKYLLHALTHTLQVWKKE